MYTKRKKVASTKAYETNQMEPNCFPLTMLVARYMILAGATALNPRMANLILM